jgi:hypothetical protein
MWPLMLIIGAESGRNSRCLFDADSLQKISQLLPRLG